MAVCYVRPGTTQISRLKQHGITGEVLTQHYLFMWEYMWSVIERGRPHAQCFVLLDLAGLKYTDIVGSSMKALRALITLLASVYPNRNQRIVLFNVPWFFNSLWQSVGPAVNPKTRCKMLLLGQINSSAAEIEAKGAGGGGVRDAAAENLSSDDPAIVDKLLECVLWVSEYLCRGLEA